VKFSLLAVVTLLVAGPARAELPSSEHFVRASLETGNAAYVTPAAPARSIRVGLDDERRPPRHIRLSLETTARAPLGGVAPRRFIRLTLDEPSVASFPPVDAFAAREELDAPSSGPVRDAEESGHRPVRTELSHDTGAAPPRVRGRLIRVELAGERGPVALSTPVPNRRIRATLD
jgi:hypothetical protein